MRQTRVEDLELQGVSDYQEAAKVRLGAMIMEMQDKYDDMTNRNKRLELESRKKDAEIKRLQEMVDHAEVSMAENPEITVRLSDMGGPSQSLQAMTSFNGTMLWKIDDFTRKRRDAVSGAQIAIYSPPFYTSQFGYKMCARIYLNGDGFGKGTHISLFFVVMKGDYDALLPWPFQKKITMMLLDQNNGEHMIDAFRSDPESSSFQRPTNNMNVASGSPLFMPLDGLSNRAYVKDDTMFIKIIVD